MNVEIGGTVTMKIRDLDLKNIESEGKLLALLKTGLALGPDDPALWTETYAASGKGSLKCRIWTETYVASGKPGKR